MVSFSVGKEILSYCNKCKLNLAHLIVVMKDLETIGKVQCKTCKSTHAYKNPDTEKIKKVRKKSNGGSRRQTKKEKMIADTWQAAMDDPNNKEVKYSPREKFNKGDLIDHPKFGTGVIEKLIESDKIEVVFQNEIKTLIHNK